MTYEEGIAAGMRRAAEGVAHEEQVRIWAQDIIEGLGFADVLKITSYDDNIAAHEVVETGVRRVCQSLTAAIPAAGAWEPPADRPFNFECLGWIYGGWDFVFWNRDHWVTRKGNRCHPAAFWPLPPAPAGEGEG